jgi:hypothetical protein
MATTLLRIAALVVIATFAGAAGVSAQAPAQKPAVAAPAQPAPAPHAPAQAAPAQPAPNAAPAPETYTYDSEGRRDPFISLVARGADPVPGKRTDGLSGISTTELMVRGVLLNKGSYIALVAGTDARTYTAHVNDRLLDGVIRTITPQGLVIIQEVNDPLSLIKQREVRKGLRTSEDGK